MKAELIYGASNNNADLLYVCGFFASDPFIYFSVEGEKFIIVSELEFDRAVHETHPGVSVLKSDKFFSRNEKNKSTEQLLSAVMRKFRISSFTVPENFPLGLAEKLKNKQIPLNIKFTSPAPFFPERAQKNNYDILACEYALSAAEKAMQKAYEILSESTVDNVGNLKHDGVIVTAETIKTAIGYEILKYGGIAEHTIVSCGIDSARPHNTGKGPIRKDNTVVIDIFPRITDPVSKNKYKGYWGDITRTFVKGKADEKIMKMYKAVKEARDRCQEMIRPGIRCGDVYNLACDILKSHGFSTGEGKNGSYGFFHGLGHGVGLEIHEFPSISPRNEDIILEEGHIITVEPGLYYPEIGGIRLENMGVVEADSFRLFNTFPDILEIP
jgi:Xaa-Pro aminopeptidase